MQAQTVRFIAYFRVSTARQGRSGPGLEAQQEAVRQYLTSVGGAVAAEFTEVETGKRNARPELAKALAACKRLKAKLVIAKLDRLSRNVAFLSAISVLSPGIRSSSTCPIISRSMIALLDTNASFTLCAVVPATWRSSPPSAAPHPLIEAGRNGINHANGTRGNKVKKLLI